MNIYYVYQYLRSNDSIIAESGTPYYIGKGKNNRAWVKNNHIVSRPTDDTFIEILVTGLSEKAAHELEIMLIKKYGRVDLGTGILRNRTHGGEGSSGLLISDEYRSKLSISHKGQIAWNKGKHQSTESNAKRSITLKGRISNRKGAKLSPELRAKISAAGIGRKHSAETRAKMSKPKSAEHRANISAALTGHIVLPETRAKIGAANSIIRSKHL